MNSKPLKKLLDTNISALADISSMASLIKPSALLKLVSLAYCLWFPANLFQEENLKYALTGYTHLLSCQKAQPASSPADYSCR